MSLNLTVNGNVYAYPEQSDTNWGSAATDWAQAVTVGMLQKAGGLFQLLAEVDLGTTYGVKSVYFKSRTALPADAGQIRLAKTDVINWRNDANDGNNVLSVNSSNDLLWNGTSLAGIATVADTSTIDLTVTSNQLTADIKSDCITNSMINSAAAIAYSKLNLTGGIVNADINASAAIAFTKLAALTDGNILVGNGSNLAASVAMSGAITIANTGVTSYSGTVPLNKGGTGQVTANAALNALLPTQTGNSGKYLTTDGTDSSWGTNPLGTVTSVAMTVPSFLSIAGSPITTSGTLALSLSGTALPLANGGTGQTTKAAAFDALSPMTTSGDIIYGGVSGTGTRLAKGTDGHVLTLASGLPSWAAAAGSGANTALSNLASVAINTALLPGANGTIDLGTSTGPLAFRDIFLTNGIKKSNAVLMLDLANARLNDASGNPSVYIDSKLLRTGTHGAPITKLDWSGAALGAVSILPLVTTTSDLGSSSFIWNNIYAETARITGSIISNGGSTPSGVSITGTSYRPDGVTKNLAIFTQNDGNNNSTATSNLYIETGNKTHASSTGDSGSIFLKTGTSVGGARGKLFINEFSIAGATIGDVLTLVSTSTGEVEWAAAGGGGANTSLSNISSTSVSDNLIPGDDWNLGESSNRWNRIYLSSSLELGAAGAAINIDASSPPSGAGDTQSLWTQTLNLGIYTKNSSDSTDTKNIYIETGNNTDTGSAGGILIRGGDSDANNGGGITLSGGISNGLGATSGSITLASGNNTGTGNSGTVSIYSGDTAASYSGDIIIYTGSALGDISGNISLSTGTSDTERGAILMSALYVNLPTGTSDPSAPEGSVYYNTTTHTLKLYNGTSWLTVTAI